MSLPQLTFTRFVAAFAVIVFHFNPNNSIFPFNIPVISKVFEAGGAAVHYFFVLSGFIMMAAYGNRKQIDKNKYWILRFGRIYPTYFIGILMIIVVHVVTPITDLSELGIKNSLKSTFYNLGHIDFTGLLLNLTLTQSWHEQFWQSINGPNWSLSVEAFFYFCFPFILPFLNFDKPSNAILIFVALAIIGFLISCWVFLDPKITLNGFLFYGSPLLSFSSFMIGTVSFKLYQIASRVHYCRWFPIAVAIMCLLLMVLLVSVFPQRYTSGYALAPLFGILIVGISLDTTSISKVFSRPFLVILGEISFAVYLYQVPVYLFLGKCGIIPKDNLGTGSFYLFVGILCIVSFLSFRFVESPVRNYIKRKMYSSP